MKEQRFEGEGYEEITWMIFIKVIKWKINLSVNNENRPLITKVQGKIDHKPNNIDKCIAFPTELIYN